MNTEHDDYTGFDFLKNLARKKRGRESLFGKA